MDGCYEGEFANYAVYGCVASVNGRQRVIQKCTEVQGCSC